MGNSKLWWWPGGGAPLRRLDFGEGLSDLQPTQVVTGSGTVVPASGTVRRVNIGGYQAVRLVLSNFSNRELARELLSLEVHIKKGFPVAFSLDSELAWAGFLRNPPYAGQRQLVTRSGNEWSVLGGPAFLSPGDEVIVSSSPPEVWREWHTVDTHGGFGLWIDDAQGMRYEYQKAPVLARQADFWPLLVLQQGQDQDLLTHQYRRTYTWQVTLAEDLAGLAALHAAGPRALTGITEAQFQFDINSPTKLNEEFGAAVDVGRFSGGR